MRRLHRLLLPTVSPKVVPPAEPALVGLSFDAPKHYICDCFCDLIALPGAAEIPTVKGAFLENNHEPIIPTSPIRVICGPELVRTFLPRGFELRETHKHGRAVELGLSNGSDEIWGVVQTLAAGGCTVLAIYERWHLFGGDHFALAAHHGRVAEVDADIIAKARAPELSLLSPSKTTRDFRKFWPIRLAAECELGL